MLQELSVCRRLKAANRVSMTRELLGALIDHKSGIVVLFCLRHPIISVQYGRKATEASAATVTASGNGGNRVSPSSANL
jgi:hypothetical protein